MGELVPAAAEDRAACSAAAVRPPELQRRPALQCCGRSQARAGAQQGTQDTAAQ